MEKSTLLFFVLMLIFSIYFFSAFNDIGVTYDENVYFLQTLRVTNASLPLNERFAFSVPGSHLPFMYLFSAPVYALANNYLDTTTALRMGSGVLFFIALCVFFFFMRKEFGEIAALISSIVLMAMPRIFFQSHLLALDFPIMALSTVAMISFYYALERRSLKHCLLAGLSISAVYATKITGYSLVIPLVIFLFYLIIHYLQKHDHITCCHLILVTFHIFIACIIFFFLIISMFHLSFTSVIDYTLSQASRRGEIFFFGHFFANSLIISFLYVAFALLTMFNAIHVLFSLFGLFALTRHFFKNHATSCLLIFFFSTLLFFSLPFVEKTDGERHFLVLFPFMAAFAGIGAQAVSAALTKRLNHVHFPQALPVAFVALFAITGTFSLVSVHPFYSSYFNLFVDGARGVAKYNMFPVTYWQDEFLYVLPWINSLPKNASVNGQPSSAPFVWYKSQGMLRKDIQVRYGPAQYTVVPLRQTSIFDEHRHNSSWGLFAPLTPVFAVHNNQGADLVRVFNTTIPPAVLLKEGFQEPKR